MATKEKDVVRKGTKPSHTCEACGYDWYLAEGTVPDVAECPRCGVPHPDLGAVATQPQKRAAAAAREAARLAELTRLEQEAAEQRRKLEEERGTKPDEQT